MQKNTAKSFQTIDFCYVEYNLNKGRGLKDEASAWLACVHEIQAKRATGSSIYNDSLKVNPLYSLCVMQCN